MKIDKFLKTLPRFHKKPGIYRISKFKDRYIGTTDFFTIVVGGTNGKGSVVTMLEQIIISAGISVGTFKSPHIYHPCERISYCGKCISEHNFREILQEAFFFFQREGMSPTLADVLTASSLLFFTKYKKPKVAIFEVGMGGRLDPVNVLKKDISIVTNVGHDHTSILGKYPEEITIEKAGIIYNNAPFITSETNTQCIGIFKRVCREKNAPYIHTDSVKVSNVSIEGLTFLYRGKRYKTKMQGLHQAQNGAISIEASNIIRKVLPLQESHIREGIERASLPWRMEIVKTHPLIIWDGSHNREGWDSLASTLTLLSAQKVQVIWYLQRSKNPADFIPFVEKIAPEIHIPHIHKPNFFTPTELKEALSNTTKINTYPSLGEAIKSVLKNAKDTIVVCGSFALSKETKKWFSKFISQDDDRYFI